MLDPPNPKCYVCATKPEVRGQRKKTVDKKLYFIPIDGQTYRQIGSNGASQRWKIRCRMLQECFVFDGYYYAITALCYPHRALLQIEDSAIFLMKIEQMYCGVFKIMLRSVGLTVFKSCDLNLVGILLEVSKMMMLSGSVLRC